MDSDELENLKKKVVKNFVKSGYPFEATVGRRFRDLEIDPKYERYLIKKEGEGPTTPIQCGVPFADPESGDSRELDVSATYPFKINGLEFWLHFQVQCKDTNRIWSFGHYGFETSPTIQNKFVLSNVSFKDHADEIIFRMFVRDPIVLVDPSALCTVGRILTKEGTKPKKQKGEIEKDEIFEATITAVKSVNFLMKLMTQGIVLGSKLERIDFFVPMVITSNLLFWLDLSEDDDLPILQTDRLWYIHRRWNAEGNIESFIVTILNASAIEEIVNWIIANTFRFVGKCF